MLARHKARADLLATEWTRDGVVKELVAIDVDATSLIDAQCVG